jgi:hypothetical protein
MANFYKAPTSNFVATTLNGDIDASQTTITLTSTSGLQYPSLIVIDRVDSGGTSTPTDREVISYTGISGNDLTGCDRSNGKSHSSGAIVEATFTVEYWNDMLGALTTVLNNDITGTSIKASTATITSMLNISGASVVGLSLSTLSLYGLSVSNTLSVGTITSGDIITKSHLKASSFGVSNKSLNNHVRRNLSDLTIWDFSSDNATLLSWVTLSLASIVSTTATSAELFMRYYTGSSSGGQFAITIPALANQGQTYIEINTTSANEWESTCGFQELDANKNIIYYTNTGTAHYRISVRGWLEPAND